MGYIGTGYENENSGMRYGNENSGMGYGNENSGMGYGNENGGMGDGNVIVHVDVQVVLKKVGNFIRVGAGSNWNSASRSTRSLTSGPSSILAGRVDWNGNITCEI